MAASMSKDRDLADMMLAGGSGSPRKQSFKIVLNRVRFWRGRERKIPKVTRNERKNKKNDDDDDDDDDNDDDNDNENYDDENDDERFYHFIIITIIRIIM